MSTRQALSPVHPHIANGKAATLNEISKETFAAKPDPEPSSSNQSSPSVGGPAAVFDKENGRENAQVCLPFPLISKEIGLNWSLDCRDYTFCPAEAAKAEEVQAVEAARCSEPGI